MATNGLSHRHAGLAPAPPPPRRPARSLSPSITLGRVDTNPAAGGARCTSFDVSFAPTHTDYTGIDRGGGKGGFVCTAKKIRNNEHHPNVNGCLWMSNCGNILTLTGFADGFVGLHYLVKSTHWQPGSFVGGQGEGSNYCITSYYL